MDAVVTVNGQQKLKREHRKTKKSIKVVYISIPMKVKTSASRFRALVQELSGRNSDVARYMEAHGGDPVVSVEECGLKSSGLESESMFEWCEDWLKQGGRREFRRDVAKPWHEPS